MPQTTSGGSLIGKIGSYLQIVTKDPRSTAFVPLAEAYRQIGLLDDALEAAKLGTRMLPHFSPGFSTLGRILGQMGRIDEAMSAYAKALSLDRQSQAALVGLSRLHLVRAERDQARKILQQAAEFHPDDEMIQNMITALDLPRPWSDLAQAPEVQAEAQPVSESQGQESEEPIPTATLAEIYVKQGLIDKAIRVYREIVRQNPENEAAKDRLAELGRDADTASNEPVTEQQPDIAAAVDEVAVNIAEPAPAVEVSVEPEQQQSGSPLEIMERWLAAINQRREHVQ